MSWRASAPVRSLFAASRPRYLSSAATKTADPLRILFCGSDEFSIASLRALTRARRDTPGLVESIDVVHRPAKPTGRGHKILRPVPIQSVATEQLNLDTHVIDTFTGWTPPVPFNLVVAVSFGLLVPPRILNLAKYGGLNVHPSLLPDLRGPAPIHHALLKERPFTGISIQTLHPKHFDRGLVLAQTPSPGIPVDHDATPTGLTSILAKEGATMLVNVLKSGAFVPSLKDVGWYSDSGGPVDHAGKITKSHHEVNFDRDTVRDILKLQRVVGAPYCILPNGARLVLHSIEDAGHSGSPPDTTRFAVDETGTCPLVHMRNGDIMRINSSTYEGQKTGDGTKRLLKLIKNKTI